MSDYFNFAVLKYAVPPLVASFILFALGVFVFRANPKSQLNRNFFYLMISFTVWQFSFACMNIMIQPAHAYFFVRAVYTGVIFIPFTYREFSRHLANNHMFRASRRMHFAICIFFLGLLWGTDVFLEGNNLYYWGYTGKAGQFHNYFLVYFYYVLISSMYRLFSYHRSIGGSSSLRANQIKYFLTASIIAIFSGYDYLGVYGVNYYPIGFIFMTIFAFINAFAIVKHHLMDIRVVIKKGALYTI